MVQIHVRTGVRFNPDDVALNERNYELYLSRHAIGGMM